VNKIETGCIHLEFVVTGELSEERDVVFRADFLGETERLSRKSLEGRGALGIYGESDCIVMITAYGDRRDSFHPLDDLMRSWPIVHQIANAPELVKFPLGQGFERSQIRVDVGNDDDFHKVLSIWRRNTTESGAC
jgi:hypothetical protein